MPLTDVEKCAGREFRTRAEANFAALLADNPDAAPCSAQSRFFRHECPAVKGRTRAVRLDDMSWLSPEIWVARGDSELEAMSPQEAQKRLEDGIVAEYEQVLAGKFAFTWKAGGCRHCDLAVLSSEGVLTDARPVPKIEQSDLSAQPLGSGSLHGLRREVRS